MVSPLTSLVSDESGTGVPSLTWTVEGPGIVTVGATLVTLMVFVAVATPPSLAVNVSVTEYEPSSSGVKSKADCVPKAYTEPDRVTSHWYETIGPPGVVTVLVRWIPVPSDTGL